MSTPTLAHSNDHAKADDLELLQLVVEVAKDAGQRLLATYSTDSRPATREEMLSLAVRNEDAALEGLRAALGAVRPDAGWVAEDQETTALPPGEWWAVDAVEGNVNHIHGLAEWSVNITLLRDGMPLLTTVYQPLGGVTYTAVHGAGAFRNGRQLHTSSKTTLDVAIVATGQAAAAQDQTYRRIGESITAMLGRALLVRATVPSTFPMLMVACGQNDIFWQYEPVLPGIAAGVLLVTEAGGRASRIDGSPWRPGSPDILVASPALHGAAVAALGTVV